MLATGTQSLCWEGTLGQHMDGKNNRTGQKHVPGQLQATARILSDMQS